MALPVVDSTKTVRPSVAYAVITLTLLAPVLGGSTQLWAQAVIIFCTGALLIWAPPRKSLGLLPNLTLVALLLIALSGFLPARWFPAEPWRIDLMRLGARLPLTRSLQPWLTLQWSCLLLLGLVWAYFLLAFQWSKRLRERVFQAFGIGVLLLAATLIYAFVTKQRIPFWPEVSEFGFFPNRNQTGNVLGLGGVMIYALGLQSLLENRRFWWLWPTSLSIISWALVLNYSRAGIILFFVGALALHLYWWSGAKDRQRPAVAFGGLVLLLGLFLINGGATLVRFGRETAGFFSENLRFPIYRDAWVLLEKVPLLGIGLGNFRPVFAVNRFYSALPNEALHPESDWLWSGIELGWVAPLLFVLLFIWWLRQCPPFAPGTGRLLRAGAMICGCGFAIHGLFDVSGHRLGALWPAIFLAGLAIHPRKIQKHSRVVSLLFRGIGILFVAIGTWWMASVFGKEAPPTTATAEQLKAAVAEAVEREDFGRVPDLAAAGIRIAPLDWVFYYKRAIAEVALSNWRIAAKRDFAIARYLEPLWPNVCVREGDVWLTVGEFNLALDAWTEALRRAGDQAPNLYAQMLSKAEGDPVLLDRLRDLAQSRQARLMVFLAAAPPFEFQMELEQLLSEDRQLQSFSPDDLAALFAGWYRKGDKFELARTLEEHPAWQKIGWRELARAYAERKDFRRACQVVEQFSTPPEVPQVNSQEPLEKLKARFFLNRSNLDLGLALYFTQIREGQIDNALITVRELETLPKSPRYLSILEAQLWTQKQKWKEAWEAYTRSALEEG